MTEFTSDQRANGKSIEWEIAELDRDLKRMEARDAFLKEAARKLAEGGRVEPLTVRALLRKFGYSRRGARVIEEIRFVLAAPHNLYTKPDFETAGLDTLITLENGGIVLTPDPAVLELTAPQVSTTPSQPEESILPPKHRGNSLAVGMLPSARKKPVSVNPDDDITVATSLMHLHDFSQLPVLRTDRDQRPGLVSWKSIGQSIARKKITGAVKEFMTDSLHVVRVDRPLFEVLTDLLAKEVVLVRDEENRISGIVTAADLAESFKTMFEPVMLISDIETNLRRIITEHFNVEEIRLAVDPEDPERAAALQGAEGLTMGEYLRLLERPENWEKLGLAMDRVTFKQALERVREVRNEVMHFSTDPIQEEDIAALRKFLATVQWMR